ncbi:conserved hypothetical protein [Xenorhabdus bovienii str. oregonense]|uniref:Uncharacterized protein n=1 Tax=Xenorhabdus bovienii str. oregonense TaxID=1398202 RepID=A0A077PAS4_XENBV|nr:conserved hypothetical protein [Xenorhabdus bovienii str. oregonense]
MYRVMSFIETRIIHNDHGATRKFWQSILGNPSMKNIGIDVSGK